MFLKTRISIKFYYLREILFYFENHFYFNENNMKQLHMYVENGYKYSKNYTI